MAMKQDPDRGVELLRKAISLRPGIPSWYAHLSSMCRSTYRMEEALTSGQESIRLDPSNADHLVNMSLVLVDADEQEQAIACLLRALGLKHDHPDAHLAMAQILLAQLLKAVKQVTSRKLRGTPWKPVLMASRSSPTTSI